MPSSVLRMRVDPTDPLAWGLGDEVDVMFSASPTFRLSDERTAASIRRVGWFDTKAPLRSGWAWGQEHLEGGRRHHRRPGRQGPARPVRAAGPVPGPAPRHVQVRFQRYRAVRRGD